MNYNNLSYGHNPYGFYGEVTGTEVGGIAIVEPCKLAACAGLPSGWKSLFVALKRNYLQNGDTDASIKAATGLDKVITTLQATLIPYEGALMETISGALTAGGIYDGNAGKPACGDNATGFMKVVCAYQKAVGIKADGYVGRVTLGKMYGESPTKYSAPRSSRPRSPVTPTNGTPPAGGGVSIFTLTPFFRANNFWLYFSIGMAGVAVWALVSEKD